MPMPDRWHFLHTSGEEAAIASRGPLRANDADAAGLAEPRGAAGGPCLGRPPRWTAGGGDYGLVHARDRLEHHHSTLVSTVRPARVAAVIKLVTDRRSVTPWA